VAEPAPVAEPASTAETAAMTQPAPVAEPAPAPTEAITAAEPGASEQVPDLTREDPDAPTQPLAGSATQWPRAIEPHGSRPRPPQEDDASSS
jgi:ribonuclease E